MIGRLFLTELCSSPALSPAWPVAMKQSVCMPAQNTSSTWHPWLPLASISQHRQDFPSAVRGPAVALFFPKGYYWTDESFNSPPSIFLSPSYLHPHLCLTDELCSLAAGSFSSCVTGKLMSRDGKTQSRAGCKSFFGHIIETTHIHRSVCPMFL